MPTGPGRLGPASGSCTHTRGGEACKNSKVRDNCWKNARRCWLRRGEGQHARASGRGTHRRPTAPAARGGRRDDAMQKTPHSNRHPWPPVPSCCSHRALAPPCVCARPCRRSRSLHSPALWESRTVSDRVILGDRQRIFNPSLDEEAGHPPPPFAAPSAPFSAARPPVHVCPPAADCRVSDLLAGRGRDLRRAPSSGEPAAHAW